MKDYDPNQIEQLDLTETGLLGRIFIRTGLTRPGKIIILLRILLAWSLAWIPLLVLSIMQGQAYDKNLKIPFLYDFAAHVRFFFAVPIFILSDFFLAPRVKDTILGFLNAGLIKDGQRQIYFSGIKKMQRLNSSIISDIAILFIVISATLLGLQTGISLEAQSWQKTISDDTVRISAAGWWLVHVSIPVWQFFLLRWLWHVYIYSTFLFNVAKLDLALIPTHPDRVGGLHFLSLGQKWLMPFVFVISAALASDMGTKIVFQNAQFLQFRYDILLFIVLMGLFVVAPLILFTPRLILTRRTGLITYGVLAAEYVRSFDNKWIKNAKKDESILGSSDIQSLADLANSYSVIMEMKSIPLDKNFAMALLTVILTPFIPLLLSAYAAKDILGVIKRIIF
ncbi:MAG: hypothetical protein A2Y07_09525 [Planctomycetes bacterium GWF2_50_10]|nr:MAG: hypothetical protein A2Y07_09525 [Planctomycetes bacterium GWF2_50_10]